ncbi:TetR family transcriptional regulator [Frigoribacterium sp. UYMn621]|jgi:TetR/AcrR family transcriptional repressor of nem operon|uniref:TetR/AcrR family transcriptional regulator n=1 Tax=Frigoribacterium sp. UYMn621 TaxID=3156343 RepID=UPI003395CC83
MSPSVPDLIASTRKIFKPGSAAEVDHDRVCEAAAEQFRRRGYRATTEAALCEATGLSPSVLAATFGGRRGLLIRTLEVYCAGQLAALETELAACESPWKWITSVVVFEDGRLLLDTSGCYLSVAASSLGDLDPEVRALSRRTFAQITRLFARALAEARDRGELRPQVDIEEAALVMLTTMQGIEFLRRASLDRAFSHATTSVIAALTSAYANQDFGGDSPVL